MSNGQSAAEFSRTLTKRFLEGGSETKCLQVIVLQWLKI